MKIKECRVAINSKEEFKRVEDICFANDIGWWNVGKEHRGGLTDDWDAIGIENDNLTQTMYGFGIINLSFDEFIEKYGKNNNIINRAKIAKTLFTKEPVKLNDNLFNKINIKLNQDNTVRL